MEKKRCDFFSFSVVKKPSARPPKKKKGCGFDGLLGLSGRRREGTWDTESRNL